MLEQEVKLPFPDADGAREAIAGAGGRMTVARRLLEDRLFDTPTQSLMRTGCALRVRRDGTQAYLTFKGPWQSGPVKAREEIETTVGAAETIEAVLAALGYQPWFRSQKFREEYAIGAAAVTVDETPFGVFVEVEADAREIERVAASLGRSPADYRLESYPAMWQRWCREHGLTPRDMVFERMP